MGWQTVGLFEYDEASIKETAPVLSGVYGLCDHQSWVYIGEANNILAALLEKRAEPCIVKHRPTAFVFEVCPAWLRAKRRDSLFIEFKPICCD
jgi:hypothetical protein